ncbi:MAG: DUF4345 family protein [Myxococcota bacterium]|nr:DUF4345 family protein [Myxococcota bacterium]
MKYSKPYLIVTLLVWLPWGLQCIFNTGNVADVIGVAGVDATGNTDIRVMYGGVQFAVGLMAALALYDGRHFEKVLWCLAFLGSCMALSRFYGLMIDDSGTLYTWGVLGYEAFAGISAICWLRVLPRLQAEDTGANAP